MPADSVPILQCNPYDLNVFINSGRIVSMLVTSLKYQYRLNMMITDYTGDIGLLIVPMLKLLRVNELDIMATKDMQQKGFTFKADVISDTASDISIDLQFTERAIIRRVGDELHVEHVGENPLPEMMIARCRFLRMGSLSVSGSHDE